MNKRIDLAKAKEVERMVGVSPRKCMKCGKCSASCPSYDEMDYHPHEFVAMVESGRIAELMESDKLWMCLSCMACLERCPRGVEPAKFVEAVRNLKAREQGANHLVSDQIPALLDPELPQQALVSAFRKYSK